MSDKFGELKQRFDAVEVPLTQRFSTGPEETQEIGMAIDDYFDRVIASFRLSKEVLGRVLLIDYRSLNRETSEGYVHPTDDVDASLWLKDVQPLASVRNVRDGHNHQVIVFAKYSFVPYIAEIQLRSALEFEQTEGLRGQDL